MGARAEIYQKLRDLANEGTAVIFASTDIQEVAGLADRVISFYRGMQVGEIAKDQITAASILQQITHPFDDVPQKGGDGRMSAPITQPTPNWLDRMVRDYSAFVVALVAAFVVIFFIGMATASELSDAVQPQDNNS